MKELLFSMLLLSVCACGSLGYPDKVTPVQDFELERYLGTWYEIARLDHWFERGLEKVTAEYAMRGDGGVHVVNRGYSPCNEEWQEAVGKAYFMRSPDEGYLKVTFFWPFYGSYVIFELDREGYQYAFVSGPDESYLWFLARTPEVSDQLIQRFEQQARSRGFDADELIYVNHR